MTINSTEFPAETFVVVAGNGPSLASVAPGRVLASDYVVRINSFFLEPEYFLGSRVDLAFLAGDPRVVPFVAETLRRSALQYDIRSWVGVKPGVARIVRRAGLPWPEEAMRQSEAAKQALNRLEETYQAEPTSGILALFLAHAMGARRIGMTGIDLYSAERRYAFDPGPRMRSLLGRDLGARSYDRRLHHPDLDKAAIDWLAAQPDVTLFRLSEDTPLAAHLDLAPPRDGPAPDCPPTKEPITDWAPWAKGWYPIQALKLMRKIRAVQRRFLSSR